MQLGISGLWNIDWVGVAAVRLQVSAVGGAGIQAYLDNVIWYANEEVTA